MDIEEAERTYNHWKQIWQKHMIDSMKVKPFLFEVGDKVIITGSKNGIFSMATRIGTVATVTARGHGFYSASNIYYLDNDNLIWQEEWLALATENFDVTEKEFDNMFE